MGVPPLRRDAALEGAEWERLHDLIDRRWPGWVEGRGTSAPRAAAARVGRARGAVNQALSPHAPPGWRASSVRAGWRWHGYRHATARERALTAELATGRDVHAFWKAIASGASQELGLNMSQAPSARRPDFLGDALTELLVRLVETADYNKLATRPTLARRAQSLIEACARDRGLLETCRAIASDGLAECGDRVQHAFDRMTFVQAIELLRRPQEPLTAIARVGRGAWRLELLDRRALAIAGDRGVEGEGVEVALALRVRLNEVLDLPLAAADVRYDGTAQLTLTEIALVGDAVLEMTSDRDALAAYLDTFPPWSAAIERLHAVELEAVKETFSSAQDALDQNRDDLQEVDLLAAWDDLRGRREVAVNRSRLQLGRAALATIDLG